MTIQIKKATKADRYYLIIDNYKVYAGTLKEVNMLAYKNKREV